MEIGYTQITVPLMGLADASCAIDLEQGLARLPGVHQVRVNYPAERAHIAYDPRTVTPDRIAAAIAELGYEAVVPPLPAHDMPESPQARSFEGSRQERALANKLLFALALTLPACLLAWVKPLQFKGYDLVLFVLTTPVVFIAGWGFFLKAWGAFRRNYANVDLLIALGILTAWLYSVLDTFTMIGTGVRFFEVAALVVTLVLLGRYLESRIKVRTGRAVRTLMGLADATARKVQPDGSEAGVPVSRIQRGDRLRIRPGERIPADGLVLEGLSSTDESLLTGQGGPTDKIPGDTALAGSVNLRGSFEMEVRYVGDQTALGQIARMVTAAQDTRVGLQDLTDKVAEIFVPVVVIIAALTFFFWYVTARPGDFTTALLTGMSVLVAACPSAIALAAPTALMAGTERAAALGVLLRGAGAIEAAAGVTTIVLRKSGVLTAGQPELATTLALEPWTSQEVLHFAGALARGSDHPVAAAFLAASHGQSLPDVMGFQAFEGLGMAGDVERHHVLVGSRRLLAARSIETGPIEPAVQPIESRGRKVVFVAVDGRLAGALAISDEVKPSAVVAVRRLKAMGLEILVLSGDSRRTTLAVAEYVGADGAISEIDPEHRGTLIRRLSEGGKRVALVGDGLGDAEALAAADVGVSLGASSDLMLKASDLTLVSSDLGGVPTALALARRILGTIRQNLFW
ncbi:MAG: cation-translocating P-type ATPase, partial [Candidatus Sericytochromatia bacterium]|nr:cation-translocating P-type ATPase [Candidatus Tanganyikabacteria bacterium]